MSKRFSAHFSSKLMINKKPKLDISRVVNENNRAGPSKVSSPKRFKCNSEDIWGDEDDDVILLASQVCDTVERYSQQIILEQNNFSELSFNKFVRDIESSTQNENSQTENFKDFFRDDNDTFNNLEDYFRNEDKERNEVKNNIKPRVEEFKAPKCIPEFQSNRAGTSKTNLENNDSMKTKNNSKDVQVNYLTRRIDTLRNENEKLSKNVSEFNEKIQTKDGEVSILRSELRHIKQVNDTLRLEKIQENECFKKEWLEKISELEKVIKSQQTELEFKNVELFNIKSKKLNETQRFNNESVVEITKKLENKNSLYNLHSLNHLKSGKQVKLLPEIFDKCSIQDKNYNFIDILYHRETENLQSILAKIKLNGQSNSSQDSNIFDSVKLAMGEFRNYVQDLEFNKYHDSNSNIEYGFLCQSRSEFKCCKIHKQENKNIFQINPIFPNEKACLIRRYVAILAIICENNPNICKRILFEQFDNNTLINWILDGLEMLGYSRELYSHYGLLESLAVLLNSLTKTIKCTENLTNIFNRYLKSLIFGRADSRSLVEISKCLNYISSNDLYNDLLNSFCTKDTSRSLVTNEFYKIVQFSPNSGLLQVYGALLEVAFPQHTILSELEINLLYQICNNHMKFIRNSFEKQTDWIWKTRTDIETCDCYFKIATSFVVLIHLILKQWIRNTKCIDIKKISKIAKVGILILSDIFHINYKAEILQIAGIAIKNRLYMVHEWLNEHKELLRFHSAHLNALQSIKLSHIISDPIKNVEDHTSDRPQDGDEIYLNIYDDFI